MKTPSITAAIADIDREIESHHQDIADLEKAKATLERLTAGARDVAKIRKPRRGTAERRNVKAVRGRPRASKGERTNERTNEQSRGHVLNGASLT